MVRSEVEVDVRSNNGEARCSKVSARIALHVRIRNFDATGEGEILKYKLHF